MLINIKIKVLNNKYSKKGRWRWYNFKACKACNPPKEVCKKPASKRVTKCVKPVIWLQGWLQGFYRVFTDYNRLITCFTYFLIKDKNKKIKYEIYYINILFSYELRKKVREKEKECQIKISHYCKTDKTKENLPSSKQVSSYLINVGLMIFYYPYKNFLQMTWGM